MRKKRFDPSYLEPKDGDFAGFVEKLSASGQRRADA